MAGRAKTPTVVLVCDVRLYRDGLAKVLRADQRLRVVGVASTESEALDAVVRQRPQAVILDVAAPEARSTVSAIVEQAPTTTVIALGLAESGREVVAYAEAGIAGYVGKDGSVDDLVGAVRKAARDEFSCSNRVAAALLRRVRDRALQRMPTPAGSILTPRERQIAALLDEGLTNKEIAGRLFIEVATVKNHVHHILEKLEANSRGEAAAKLRRREAPRQRLDLPAAVIHKSLS